MMFINLEKTSDKALHEVLWRCLGEKGVSVADIRVIQNM